jgi:DNA gyrase subunit A
MKFHIKLKADMLVHIADLVSKGTVVGIRDIRDESSKEGIRVVIEVKNNAIRTQF